MNGKRVTVGLTALVIVVAVLVVARVGGASPLELQQGGGAPSMVSYQGQVKVGGVPYNGTGYFKYAIWSGSGGNNWTNDGSALGGGEPTDSVSLQVNGGLFNVLLGDTSLTNMTALEASVFDEPERYLRVWFSSDNSTFTLLSPDQRIAAVPYALQAEKVKGYANVVVVAKSGGDFTSVQAAIDSITDAAADNPYLVWVAPGVYEEQVTMKSYVHLQGAGQEATVITSTASSSVYPPVQATLLLASNASLRDLTVGNKGDGSRNAAILATGNVTRTLAADVVARAQGDNASNYAFFLSGSGTGVMLQQVTALAENAITDNIGLVIESGTAAVLHGGSFIARGGDDSIGIANFSGTLEAKSASALAENGSTDNYSLLNNGGATTLHGGTFTGRGGVNAYGIWNYESGTTLETEGVTALAENGSTQNWGLGNSSSATVTLRGGSFIARGGETTTGISNDASGSTLTAESVTVLGEDGSFANLGLRNKGGAAAVLHGGSFTARGGVSYTYGIYNRDVNTTLEAEGVTALAENGSGEISGLRNTLGAAVVLRGGSFTGRGGDISSGIINSSVNSTLEAESVTVLGEDGRYNVGLYNNNDATVKANSSQFIGSSDGLHQNSGTVHLGVSQLDGGVNYTGGTLTCFQVYDGNYAAYECP